MKSISARPPAAKIFDHLHKIANAVRLKEETRLTEAGVITGIDLCFLMDCTSSMGSWITAAKEELFKVVASTKAAHPDARLRVAYVRASFIAARLHSLLMHESRFTGAHKSLHGTSSQA